MAENKIAIVTGANTGLGFELSRKLLNANYEVIMACRSLEKGQAAIDLLNANKKTFGGSPVLMQLDLANLKSIREFAEEFKGKYASLDLLVNNAGLSMDFKSTDRYTTTDGFELTVGTNHLGHFLLTNLLLDMIKSTGERTGDARIVNVTSMLHQYGGNRRPMKDNKPMDFDDLMMEKEGAYSGVQAYKNSKAMNVLFTKKLSRMLVGTGVTSNCICPGFVPTTEFMRNVSGCTKCFLTCCIPFLGCIGITRTLDVASTHMLNLCIDPSLKDVSGVWYTDGAQHETSEETRIESNQDYIWQWSAEKCSL